MNDTYRKYAVYNEYGKEAHTVIAHAFSIRDGGTLVFTKTSGNSFETITAFAAGYWSKVELVELVETIDATCRAGIAPKQDADFKQRVLETARDDIVHDSTTGWVFWPWRDDDPKGYWTAEALRVIADELDQRDDQEDI